MTTATATETAAALNEGAHAGMDKYKEVRDIGSGNFGVARLMRNRENDRLVVVKLIERGHRYHTMSNVLFMAKTKFLKLHEELDWNFIRAKQDQIAFLFGVDDHWGPLTHLEEISRHAPGVALSMEKEGHTHGYCCTEAGSFWVADYAANLIKNRMLVRDS
ncbi:hypothetical protein ZWY2020_019215 [Hordeum vulgare]|nr:hypothetical protein ZWY2020_019215 [Hordeum vulgare]